MIKRITTSAEWAEVKPLFHALQAFEKSLRPERKTPSDGPLQYVIDNIAAQDGACFAAFDDTHTIVGFIAGWIVAGDGLDEGDNRIGEISDCFILPRFRNAFLFKKLGAAMIVHFENCGLRKMSFATLGTNTRMQNLSVRLGYAPHKVIFEMDIGGAD